MTQVEMVPLSKIRDNPWRDRVRNPIDAERVEAIATSIEKTKKYWTGTYGRKVAGGIVELAFGHHRVEAAKAQGLKEIPIIIETFTDGEMLVWMAQENVGGGLPVILEAVHAAVKALGEGKIEVEAVGPDTKKSAIRYAPSFIPGKPPSTTVVDRAYTTYSIARYLGFVKRATDTPKNSVIAAVGILEQAEMAAAEGGESGKRKAAALEKSFSVMKVNDAAKAVSDIKQREAKVAARTNEAKKAATQFDAEQRKIQAERKAVEEKAEAEREKLVKQIAAAKKDEDDKRAEELKARLAAKKVQEAEQEVTFKLRQAALNAQVEERKVREAETKKVDEYAPIKREVERILHKLDGSTATTRDGLGEEVKALARQTLTPTDRERLRQAAISAGNWFMDWVAMQFVPPFGGKKDMAEYRRREEAARRMREAKEEKDRSKKEKKHK